MLFARMFVFTLFFFAMFSCCQVENYESFLNLPLDFQGSGCPIQRGADEERGERDRYANSVVVFFPGQEGPQSACSCKGTGILQMSFWLRKVRTMDYELLDNCCNTTLFQRQVVPGIPA